MDGQAAAPAPDGLGDLASFLADTADEATDEEEGDATESTAEGDNEEEASDQSDDAEDQDDESEDDGEEKDPDPATGRKFKVTVKGDDGEDSTVEVEEKELIAGYQRQADYTRKTQELAARENEAVEFLKGKHQEVVSHYLGQAEFVRAAIVNMAGIKSESEMAQLAQTDPGAWAAERQRVDSIRSFLSQLDDQIQGERKQLAEQQEQMRMAKAKEMFQRTWQELNKAKIDKPALGKIYGSVAKNYGFSPQELGNVYDHRIVLMMRDAAAYRDLQAKKPEVTRKVEAAKVLPATKSAAVAQSQRSREREQRFKAGRAKLADLAAVLM